MEILSMIMNVNELLRQFLPATGLNRRYILFFFCR